jgi:small subunit ribosomal protein S16
MSTHCSSLLKGLVGIRSGGKVLLAIKLMRTGAKKRPSYRVVVKEKQSKRDGAYLENIGTYNPTREPAEIKLDMDRVRYWIGKGAQPTDTVDRLIKASDKQQPQAPSTAEA